MTTNDPDIYEPDQAEASPRREKWFVGVWHLQAAVLLIVAPLYGIAKSPRPRLNQNWEDVVEYWILVAGLAPLLLCGAVLMLIRASAYLGMIAVKVWQPRLDRKQQLELIWIGAVLAPLSFIAWDQNLQSKLVVVYTFVFCLMSILWGVDEMQRSRAEPLNAEPPSEV